MEAEIKTTGFPSPSQGYAARSIDLNELLITHPAASYFFAVDSPDMAYKGLFPGSYILVDRAKKLVPGAVAVISYEGAFLCREAQLNNGKLVFTNGQHEADLDAKAVQLFGTVSSVVIQL